MIYLDYHRLDHEGDGVTTDRSILDQAVLIMKALAAVAAKRGIDEPKLSIDGHAAGNYAQTTAKDNLWLEGLSKRRAAACSAYIVSRGVSATSLQAAGFGCKIPAASGKDSKRVEINLKNGDDMYGLLTFYIAPLFFRMAQNLDLRCVLISDPSTSGAGAKTRLESRIKKFTPHCVFGYAITSRAKNGFEMCFAPRTLMCMVQNTSRIHTKV